MLRNARRFSHSYRVDERVPAVTQNREIVRSSSLDLFGSYTINFIGIESSNAWDILRDVVSRAESLRSVSCVVSIRLFHSAGVRCGITARAWNLCLI